MRVAWLLVLAGCLGKQQPFNCETDLACGVAGHCEGNGFCSFDDSTCSQGRRYGELAGSFSQQCVGQNMVDADLSCTCAGDSIHCAMGSDVACAAGCLPRAGGGARCATPVPSNELDKTWADEVSLPISINDATFDTDTGEITGSVTRAPGEGVASGIGFHLHTSMGQAIGVFVFAQLDVPGALHLAGGRSAAFLIAGDASITGTIDGAGGCGGVVSCAGPGGGSGATPTVATTGPGAAGNGGTEAPGANGDGGGGGGGGGGTGARGGNANAASGGTAGPSCIAASIEPLVGGGGGGTGAGGSVMASEGGGGGGAFQITAFGTLNVVGTIQMGGMGGAGGSPVTVNAGAGGGGGGGGAILLEAIELSVPGHVVANGGAGGSGANGNSPGLVGAPGGTTTSAAVGGASVNSNGAGGNGGSRAASPTNGGDSGGNAGGGGGAAGAIRLRAVTVPSPNGTVSPQPATDTVPVS